MYVGGAREDPNPLPGPAGLFSPRVPEPRGCPEPRGSDWGGFGSPRRTRRDRGGALGGLILLILLVFRLFWGAGGGCALALSVVVGPSWG